MKTNGKSPKKKKIIPELIILYVNPLNMAKSMWPESILAANLSPNETFLAKYENTLLKCNHNNNFN